MPIDKVLVIRKMNLIGRDLKRLKPLSQLSFKNYLSKYENEILAERYLERIIGRIIDINYHLITGVGNLPPKDYFESFTMLGELGILSKDLAQKLAGLAGVRNRLAHEYNEIDEKKIYQVIKSCYLVLPRYFKSIKRRLKFS